MCVVLTFAPDLLSLSVDPTLNKPVLCVLSPSLACIRLSICRSVCLSVSVCLSECFSPSVGRPVQVPLLRLFCQSVCFSPSVGRPDPVPLLRLFCVSVCFSPSVGWPVPVPLLRLFCLCVSRRSHRRTKGCLERLNVISTGIYFHSVLDTIII